MNKTMSATLLSILLTAANARTSGVSSTGVLPGGTFAFSYGVSDDGTVAVGNGDSPSDLQAFRWTSAGGIVGLGTLPGHSQSIAEGISGDGGIVIGECYLPIQQQYEAFR